MCVHKYSINLQIAILSIQTFSKQALFFRVCSKSLLKTLWEKEKLLVMSNFSFFPSVFYPFGGTSAIFIKFKIVVSKLFQFGRVRSLLFGKGLRRFVNLGPYSPTILKNIPCLFLQDFVNLNVT